MVPTLNYIPQHPLQSGSSQLQEHMYVSLRVEVPQEAEVPFPLSLCPFAAGYKCAEIPMEIEEARVSEAPGNKPPLKPVLNCLSKETNC